MSSNANTGRRRSGVWNTGSTDADTDVVHKEKESRRHRWTPGKKEPTMYDEYLNSDKKRHRASGLPSRSRTLERRPSMPLRSSSTAVRPETPENAPGALGFEEEHRGAEESTTSLERPFTPASATRDPDRPSSSSKTRRAIERVTSPGGNRSGSFSVASALLGRSRSRHKPKQDSQTSMTESEAPSTRPRTATLEGRIRTRSRSRQSRSRSRHGGGSSHAQSSPISQGGAEYLASVPVSTHEPSAPSISSVGSPVRSPSPQTGTRSISPMSSGTADSITSALPSANARRILHLMKTLNGRMSGNVVFRRGFGNPWSQSYCYINDDSGSLMYESRGSEGAHKTLVQELRGSSVRSNLDGDVPYLELSFPQVPDEVHIKLQTQSDFDAWFAALLHWTPRGDITSASSSDHQRSDSEMGMTSQSPSTTDLVREDLARKRGGSMNETAMNNRDRAASKASNKSDPRRSLIGGATKENPVIKIGKMIYWDTNIGYNNTSGLGQPSTARPSTGRMMSMASRRWRRISGQLRENGELKLHSDADNSLISIVQLSQLSRCAIQRLDSSVLDNDFCIAIYPQYTSSFANTQPGFIRPIFLSLENRVLFEVWFVLLRAFTMPSIYGPRIDNEDSEFGEDNQDLESMIATSTTYTFRMERSLSVRVGEAKMQSGAGAETSFTSGFGKNSNQEKHGYYAEVLLDNETRGKTVVKYQGLNPLWGESFEFQDLPPVLSNASVLVKRRTPEQPNAKDHSDKSHGPDAFGQQQDGYTNLTNDVVCGKVEIQMEELEPEKEIEKWWPVSNMHGQRVGEVLIKIRADEGIILMARDYKKLDVMLHRFSNALTLQIAQTIPTELKRLSDSLLNIFQVSGKAGDWIMALVEEEIDGSHKESPITRLRYSRRASNEQGENSGMDRNDRELLVRDMNKNATLEANLLFRGNTLLTKSLDTHMRRVGKEYLEESLAAKLQEINDKNEDCEVDPNRVNSPSDLDRNWRRLLLCTQDVWKGVVANKARCPVELRIIFRHIRACAEDRYGDFLRSVSYSSVSGFLFLRFFCPAVLNPKLFGLLQDDIKPRARRTFTLIAKSLQTMANMAAFGTKEPWMEPMNVFLVQHRESFKTFIDDVCFVPAPLSGASYPNAPNSPTYPPGVVSAEQHLSYTTPMTIMQRLPPSSREGFPSLPYLIDQARSFADLIHLWLEAVMALSNPSDNATLPGKTHSDILDAIMATDGELGDFHVLCEQLNTRTQECLNRAERAERPDSSHSFQWEDVINQLQKAQIKNSSKEAFDNVAAKIASDPNMLPDDDPHAATIDATMRQLRSPEDDGDDSTFGQGPYSDTTLARTEPTLVDSTTPRSSAWGRPGSISHASSFQGSSSRGYAQSVQDSPSQSASASAVSSDTENTTTALPNYDREIRHRERREMARFQIQKQVEAAQSREKEKSTQKEKRKMTSKLVPNLMKMKKDKHKEQDRQSFATKSNGAANGNEYGGMI
ncbi:unnamed protein product [Zymoseptoria tritici ST99CH_3D7]|uniref:Uncharacterized protein n=1 Tax=Zymoseptoria tritici (strain ST99CH_3D7) TaxID=1276538 RepID=A0A1X7RD63_ZYMT9|nr:unnamed protein product [Zymoseptoria tritici ST99CH_3D7]